MLLERIKVGPGWYRYQMSDRHADVRKVPGLGWVASAGWNHFIRSDRCVTMREANYEALDILLRS